ncbi:N-acetyltransferase 10 [Chlorella sorokiniana]|uniref:RNA cytidine acetyltransferase n=1 Tax=Chlorella sorokiniana TaxID=3076 RepID=A0A2P6TV99_CHLSO|nr:N-acetyltransferase 10 [Chlorella sorokiniana]|eukprot:PRW57974.1 N-acetyltransferase 10 [Chlorella sorokiniana]
MRKKVDSRIRTLVENSVKTGQRSLFVIVGDKGRDQVVNLHYMLSKTVVKARPSVLWCYKKELYLSSHKKKRMKQIKKMAQRGLLDPEKEDPFSLFVASTNIRYCYYSDTHKILGNTYGMLVLQDFEALTPNLLARTVETVEGGGIVVLLLSNLSSLSQLYSLTMDVHSRLRTESHQTVTGRFNERLVLSLASCPNCILMDDELNILPTSTHVKYIQPLPTNPDGSVAVELPQAAAAAELRELSDSLADTQPAGALVGKCRTLDQAKAVVTFLDAASEKTLRSTVALTAARGRGKSAALGLAIAGALALGYSNIFVTAPSPENLRTLFEFVFKGLDELDYKEHIDYDLVESTNPAFGKAVVRVNVFRNHRQTVQYIQPQHHAKLAQAELLVIDEAAAIPLPLVKAMLGPYLVFLCSTVNGYEGTGRSLSLKLIQQLRQQGAKLASGEGKAGGAGAADGVGGGMRTFREVILGEPIRYSLGDKVERWLNDLLCLDAAEHTPPPPARLPHPDECDLYYVERDTLFSYHKASETFLQRMMALYVASHYKNTPNDLILMSDAPAHHLFVLLGPVDETQNALPDVLAVVQVALEGAISRRSVQASLAAGQLPQGDLIPWTVGQQYQDSEFPQLSGARVVRIAVHPEVPRAGYGTRALEQLRRYYEGEIADVMSEDEEGAAAGGAAPAGNRSSNGPAAAAQAGGLLSEELKPRAGLPPLLVNLAERPAERLHYLGVSFGLTQTLYSFWRRSAFQPVYLRQTPSDVTGEHTVIMLRPLRSVDVADTAWLAPFVTDFRGRFMQLLGGAFRGFAPALVLSILDPKLTWSEAEQQAAVQQGVVVRKADGSGLSPYDLKRLQAYANSLVDHHLILDLMPPLAANYFAGRLPAPLSYSQAAILAAVGLQQHEIGKLEETLGLPASQALALFNKAVRRLHGLLRAAKEAEAERSLPRPAMAAAAARAAQLAPHEAELDAELDEAAEEIKAAMREQFRPEDLAQFAIAGDADFEGAVGGGAALRPGGLVTVKGDKKRAADGGSGSGSGKKEGGRKDARQQQQGGGGGKKHKSGGGDGRQQKKKSRQ